MIIFYRLLFEVIEDPALLNPLIIEFPRLPNLPPAPRDPLDPCSAIYRIASGKKCSENAVAILPLLASDANRSKGKISAFDSFIICKINSIPFTLLRIASSISCRKIIQGVDREKRQKIILRNFGASSLCSIQTTRSEIVTPLFREGESAAAADAVLCRLPPLRLLPLLRYDIDPYDASALLLTILLFLAVIVVVAPPPRLAINVELLLMEEKDLPLRPPGELW